MTDEKNTLIGESEGLLKVIENYLFENEGIADPQVGIVIYTDEPDSVSLRYAKTIHGYRQIQTNKKILIEKIEWEEEFLPIDSLMDEIRKDHSWLKELGLSGRALNAIKNSHAESIDDVIKIVDYWDTYGYSLSYGIGKVAIEIIRQALINNGYLTSETDTTSDSQPSAFDGNQTENVEKETP